MEAVKHNIIRQLLFVIGLTLAKTSIVSAQQDQSADVVSKTIYEIQNETVAKYQQNGASEFEDFHDQFLVLNHYGLPNLKGAENGLKLADTDYDNPQKLAEYDQQHTLLQEKERLAINAESERTGKSYNEVARERELGKSVAAKTTMIDDMFRTPTKAEQDAQRERDKAYSRKYNTFMKAGYFGYFTDKLDDSREEAAFVNLCVNIDYETNALAETDYRTPRREVRKMIRSELEGILSTLGTENYKNPDFEALETWFSCNVNVDVNKSALSLLNQNESIASFIHPELILSSQKSLFID